MSSDIIKAYELGKRLALTKLSQKMEGENSSTTEVEELTKKLDYLVRGSQVDNSSDILDSSERSSSATWGDKMELETNSNTGINV